MRKGKFGLTSILISFVILYSIMPVVNRLTSRYVTTYAYMLVLVLLFVVIVFGQKLDSVNKYLNVVLPMIAFEALTYFIKSDSILIWGYKVLLFLIPTILGYYLIYKNHDHIKYYGKIIVLCLFATAVTTIIGCIRSPSAARYLATVASPDEALAVRYSMRNIAGYDFVYTVTLLYPLWILAYKRQKIIIPVFWAGTFGCLILIICSEYTTALLLFLISSALIFVKRKLRAKDLIVLMIVAVLFVVVFSGIISSFLSFLSDQVGSREISERLTALSGGQSGLESAEDNRIWLYRMSITTFLSNPILGTFLKGGYGTGGHSEILDSVAKFGLLGIAAIYGMYRKVYLLFFQPFESMEGYGYYLWLFLQAILLSFINTGFWLIILTFYAPLIFLHINDMGGLLHENSLGS